MLERFLLLWLTLLSLLAYGFGRLFGLEGPWMVGVVMVGCMFTGTLLARYWASRTSLPGSEPSQPE